MRNEPYIGLDQDAGQWVEHICLASDEVITTGRRHVGRMGPTFKFVSRVLSRETELAFITDHRLRIRVRRRGKSTQYAVDLRFVDADAIFGRRFDWRPMHAAFALAGLGVLAGFVDLWASGSRWAQVGLLSSVVLAGAALSTCVVAIHRHLSTFELRSVHGDALLARVVAGVSGARRRREFAGELSGRVEAARREPLQSKQQFLCDEMREHHRLWSEGVLSDVAYESSKRRILASHA